MEERGMVKWGTVPKFFVCVITVLHFVFYRFDLRHYMGQQVCFCGKVKFCLLVHIKHWSRYLIEAQLYFNHVITKQKCCLNHNDVNSCELS
jgi:hypothetical protein